MNASYAPWTVVSIGAGVIITLSYFWLIRDIVRNVKRPAAVLAAVVPAITVLPAVVYATTHGL